MATHDYDAIGRAVVLIASLFAGEHYVEAPTKAAPKSPPPKDEPKQTSSDASATTAAESTVADNTGNSQGLDVAAFTKIGLDFANSNKPTSGTQLKGILKDFGQERLGAIEAKDYDAFLEKIEEAKLA